MEGYKSVSIREEVVKKIKEGAKEEKRSISLFLDGLIEDKVKRVKKINALEELGNAMEEARTQIPTKEEIREIIQEEIEKLREGEK